MPVLRVITIFAHYHDNLPCVAPQLLLSKSAWMCNLILKVFFVRVIVLNRRKFLPKLLFYIFF